MERDIILARHIRGEEVVIEVVLEKEIKNKICEWLFTYQSNISLSQATEHIKVFLMFILFTNITTKKSRVIL